MSHTPIHFYNTLGRDKQLFTPIDPDHVGIYSCGLTVYSAPHIGNMRKYFLDDLIKNIIKHIGGYTVTHVVNITDVGHLTGENEGDADHGEDKMEKGARKEGLTARDVAKKYEDIFHADCRTLGLDLFDVVPRATDHIPEQIAMIQQLESKGYTYTIDGDGIYMDTSKVENYAILVGQKHLDGLMAGARIDLGGRKNATDFALWKFNMTSKKRDMERPSPRGVGFPGRHIECSAMSIKYLGHHFDIHTGGLDHIPIHHTNEIAQSQCSCGSTPWVNYWLHYQFLNINGTKVSKSLGNVVTVNDIIAKGYDAQDLRYFYLQTHYRSFQDFTRELLDAAASARKNLKKLFADYVDVQASPCMIDDISYLTDMLADDFQTAKMLSRLRAGHEALDPELVAGIRWLDEKVLKLGLFEPIEAVTHTIPDDIYTLAQSRRDAKLARDFAQADMYKQQMIDAGWTTIDTKEDYKITKISCNI